MRLAQRLANATGVERATSVSKHLRQSRMTEPQHRDGTQERLGWRRAALALEPPTAGRGDQPRLQWRRLFSEAFGTFLLVLAAAGPAVVNAKTGGGVSRAAAVTAPGLTVMAVILFMGGVSGAHLNPAITLGFTLRRDFPWRRVPGYVIMQLAGAALACLFLRLTLGNVGGLGTTVPGRGIEDWQALLIEVALTVGLVSTILGTSSRAQNVGPLSALAIGGYIALAGLWSSPISGASMNPARSFGPALITGDYAHLWLYIAGPLAGSLIAVAFAWVLRGPSGDAAAARAARGRIEEQLKRD